tara:strand:+ start:226 stop:567 length:342 start_codon:yes stop_codon:yes gene_type:complete
MAYYNFTEIESYTENSVAHKKYKVQEYSDSDKTKLVGTSEVITCGDKVDKPQDIMTEIEGLTTPEANPPYTAKRKMAYPSIEEQLDMQYWDSVNGTSTWKDAIAKVKSDLPKS